MPLLLRQLSEHAVVNKFGGSLPGSTRPPGLAADHRALRRAPLKLFQGPGGRLCLPRARWDRGIMAIARLDEADEDFAQSSSRDSVAWQPLLLLHTTPNAPALFLVMTSTGVLKSRENLLPCLLKIGHSSEQQLADSRNQPHATKQWKARRPPWLRRSKCKIPTVPIVSSATVTALSLRWPWPTACATPVLASVILP